MRIRLLIGTALLAFVATSTVRADTVSYVDYSRGEYVSATERLDRITVATSGAATNRICRGSDNLKNPADVALAVETFNLPEAARSWFSRLRCADSTLFLNGIFTREVGPTEWDKVQSLLAEIRIAVEGAA